MALLPFILVIATYFLASSIRLAENPADKLLPSIATMADAMDRVAFAEDKRTGEYLLWVDTWSSLERIFTGVGCAALFGLLLGLNMGMFRGLTTMLSPFVTFISMIPPLA